MCSIPPALAAVSYLGDPMDEANPAADDIPRQLGEKVLAILQRCPQVFVRGHLIKDIMYKITLTDAMYRYGVLNQHRPAKYSDLKTLS